MMHTCAQLLLLLHLLHFQPPIKADFGAIGTSGLGWLAEELIHDDDVDDDVTSSYVDDAIYDFDVSFPRGTSNLGLLLDENLTIARMEDSKAAELTGYLRQGDLLVSVNGVPVEHRHDDADDEADDDTEDHHDTPPSSSYSHTTAAFTLTTRAAAQHAINQLEISGEWFWLRFRPARLEKRGRRPLYDHNVTVNMEDSENSVRLGLMLSTGLVVHGMIEGSPMWENGRIKTGDVLVAIGEQVVTGKSLKEVSNLLQMIMGQLDLRFRLPKVERILLERKRRKDGESLFMHEERRQHIGGDGGKSNGGDTYEVVYDTLQELGLILSTISVSGESNEGELSEVSDVSEVMVVVSGFQAGTRDGVLRSSPAESDGIVKIGDYLLEIDGAPVEDIHAARQFVSQRTHQEILKCRGGKVTRYCSIERVERSETRRRLGMRRGPKHYERVTRRVSRSTLSSLDGEEKVTMENIGGGGGVEQGSGESSMKVGGGSGSGGGGGSAVVVDEQIVRSRYAAAIQKAREETRDATTMLMPNGKREEIFRSTRGFIIGQDELRIDFSNSLFGGPIPCDDHPVVVAVPFDGCRSLKNNNQQLRNSYVIVQRGGCFFSDKAINAQYAGAAGLIVIDRPKRDLHGRLKTKQGSDGIGFALPERMPANAQDGHLVKIFAIAVHHFAGEMLLEAVREMEERGGGEVGGGGAGGGAMMGMVGAEDRRLRVRLAPENMEEGQCPTLKTLPEKKEEVVEERERIGDEGGAMKEVREEEEAVLDNFLSAGRSEMMVEHD